MELKLYSTGLVGDSGAYDILDRATRACAEVPGPMVEIGTRRGGSTKVIIDAILACPDVDRSLICIDPYGNIEYQSHEDRKVRLDYDNSMRDDTLKNLYAYTHGKKVNLFVLIMEDTEYFKRFADGYPVYQFNKRIEDKYSLVFFDGPHDVASLKAEIDFFNSRSNIDSHWVFDDIQYYPHDVEVEPLLFSLGWELVEKRNPKASYKKVR